MSEQPNDTRPLVIYHGGCWDGFCAAWLLRKVFPHAEFVPAQYGDSPPNVAGRTVFIADFSYKRPVMAEIIRAASRVLVLDHHKTAADELAYLCDPVGGVDEFAAGKTRVCVIFDMEKSGARLTWEYLFRGPWSKFAGLNIGQEFCKPDSPPWLVRYTEDRDLWRHALPNSKEINAALRSHPLDFGVWETLLNYDVDPHGRPFELIPEGTAILRRERQIIDDHKRHAREFDMDGHGILAVNATVLFSEIAGELAEGRPFGACYFDRADGKRQWSLRSRADGVDVSEIARRRGGGGHRNAAGFEDVAA